jgi:hypothetical protein
MNATDREQLRLSLLRFLDENVTRFGFQLGYLLQRARSEGRPKLTADEVDAEILYLEDKGFIAQPQKQVSPELRAWRITAAGRDFLAMATA